MSCVNHRAIIQSLICVAGKFEDEIHPGLKHTGAGILSMVQLLLAAGSPLQGLSLDS
jgi:hypothetical protein